MASRQIPVIYRGWEGGLNDSKNLLALRDNELADIRNFYVARDGHVRRRAGQDAVYASSFQSSEPAHGLAQVRLGGTRYLVTTYGTAIQKDNTGAITGTASLTAGQDKPVVMTVFRDLLVGCQSDVTAGINAPFAWNGTGNAAALTTSPPSKAVSVATFKNRLVFWNCTFGGTDYPENVVWSKIDTATTWPTNQIAAVYRGTGRYGTVAKPFFRGTDGGDGEVLILFKDIGTFFLYHNPNGAGASAFGIGRISDSVGCPAPQGVVEAGGVLYWPSYSGFYRMGADMTIGPRNYIGGSIEQLWKKIPKNRFPHIKGAYLEDLQQVWFAVSVAATEGGAQTTNNRVLAWDTYFQKWVGVYSGINANVMAQVIDSNLNRHIYSGDYSNYLIYKQNTGLDDDGTGFAAWVKTGYMGLGSPGTKKNFRRVLMEVAADTEKVGTIYTTLYNITATQSRAVTVGTTGTVLDEFTLDVDTLASSDYAQWWGRQGGSARYAQFELNLPANAKSFDLYGLGYYVVPMRSGPGVSR